MVILWLVVVALLLGGGWLWFRDSSFVAVQKVTVTGERGPDAAAISSALESSARSMTTLDVQTGRLYSAVSAYPVVRSLKVTAQFPHGMVIQVTERLPVAVVIVAGRREAVSADGSLLRDLTPVPALPRVGLAVSPGGPRLNDPQTVEELAAVTAAPGPIRNRIIIVRLIAGPGLVATIRNGPAIYLGDAAHLRAKWESATAVLADPGSAGATYIDVSDPRRPAAGATASGTTASTSSQASSKSSNGIASTDTQPPPSVKGSAWTVG
jgi:cell division protein FtsQ